MADTTILIDTLKKLLATYGLILIKDDRRLERLLLEYCNSNKREINVLITAIRFGVVDSLISASAKQLKPSYIQQLGENLQADTGIPLDYTRWAVATWIDALRVVIPQPEVYQKVVPPTPTNHENTNNQTPSGTEKLIIELDEDTSIELIRIPSGEFLMGSDIKDKEAFDIEKPQHKVHLPDFYIGKYVITNSQFEVFRKKNNKVIPFSHPGTTRLNHPVTGLSWDDAIEYCHWLTQLSSNKVRLPSEAEWEKAARGAKGLRWPWGNRVPDRTFCNSDGLVGDTTPVGNYSPQGDSPYGCADMSGNVWEWTNSILKDYPYHPNDGRENLQVREDRVLRGGSYHYNSLFARCTVRVGGSPDLKSRYFGFRIAVSIG